MPQLASKQVAYTPATPSNWPTPTPTNAQQALDDLTAAGRFQRPPVNAGHVLIWQFNEPSGSVATIPNTAPGGPASLLRGSNGLHPAYGAQGPYASGALVGVDGTPNGSAYFIGTGPQATIAGQQLSIEMMFEMSQVPPSYADLFGYQYESQWGGPGNHFATIGLGIDGSNNVAGQGRWVVRGDQLTTNMYVDAAFGLPTGRPVIIMGTIDLSLSANNVLLYQDGTLVATYSTAALPGLDFNGGGGFWYCAGAVVAFGTPDTPANDPWRGKVYEVRYSNVVQSAAYAQAAAKAMAGSNY